MRHVPAEQIERGPSEEQDGRWQEVVGQGTNDTGHAATYGAHIGCDQQPALDSWTHEEVVVNCMLLVTLIA
jgi:hypothetical protein